MFIGGKLELLFDSITCADSLWNDRDDLFWKDVCTVFLRGEFISGEVVQRGCAFMRHVAGDQDAVYIANIYAMQTLLFKDMYQYSTFEIQPDKIKSYITAYPDSSWTHNLDQDRIVLVPINYPVNVHWCLVVMWKNKSGHFVRVYNSLKSYKEYDREVASTCAHVCGCMDERYAQMKWKFWQPHDHVEQKANQNRCGLHVIARAWQVCNRQHLTHVMNRGVYENVANFVCYNFLDNTEELCGDGALPSELLP